MFRLSSTKIRLDGKPPVSVTGAGEMCALMLVDERNIDTPVNASSIRFKSTRSAPSRFIPKKGAIQSIYHYGPHGGHRHASLRVFTSPEASTPELRVYLTGFRPALRCRAELRTHLVNPAPSHILAESTVFQASYQRSIGRRGTPDQHPLRVSELIN